MGNGRERPTGTETDREHRKGRQARARRTTGTGSKKVSIGGERGGVLGDLRGKGCQLDLALTTSGTGATRDCSWHFSVWLRPTLTWAFSRIPSERMASTPANRLGTVSLLQTRRAHTVAEWPCSTDRHHILRWRPCVSLALTLSDSSWRRECGGDISLDVTSPPTKPRR